MDKFLKKLVYFIIMLCNLFAVNVFANDNLSLIDLRVWKSEENTRITIETSKKIKFNYENKEKKLTLDIKENLSFNKYVSKINTIIDKHPYIKEFTYENENKKNKLNYFFKEKVDVNIFTLNPIDKYKYRIVIDIKKINKDKISKKEVAKKYFIVAIDAGHGGEDPGAIGDNGTYEKDITFLISKKLKEDIDKIEGFKAVLIRKGDYFIPLQERIEKAHKYKADILISVHADSAEYKEAQGSSVYILSERGASSASTKWLAEKENFSDLIGGAKITKKENYLKKMLIDMMLTSNIQYSKKLADNIIWGLKSNKQIEIHKEEVESAAFAILKSPKVPSVLVETAFISNKKEEAKLKNKKFQEQMVKAILEGIKKYKKHVS